jgi:hypothetical protein
MVVVDYVQSLRIGIEWILAIAVCYLMLQETMSSSTVLATWALLTLVLTGYSTSVICDMAEQPHQLWRFTALRNRTTYLAAYITASFAVSGISYVVMVVATAIFNPIVMPSMLTILATLPSLMTLMVSVIFGVVLVSPLISTTWQRLVVLVIVTIPLAWNLVITMAQHRFNIMESALLDSLTTLFGVVVWPILHLYAVSITPNYSWLTVLFLFVQFLANVGVAWIVVSLFRRKLIRICQ